LAQQSDKSKAITVEKDIPIEIDAGLLCATDLNPVDQEQYEANKEEYLTATARDGVQVLLTTLFSLPINPSPDGPLGVLPPPVLQLPRSKPLPKPKPPTKWERFAAAKGIQHKKRDKKVWDEEKQDWVNRWGKGGKNRELDDQWLTEVPANAEVDYDAAKVARDERRTRVAKNEKQHLQNVQRAEKSANPRVSEIDKTLATTRGSTASMGKFDTKLVGEKKLRGVKRKFEANEQSMDQERKKSLALVSKLGEPTPRKREGNSDVVNVRKAIRGASGGKGSRSLVGAKKKTTGKGFRSRK